MIKASEYKIYKYNYKLIFGENSTTNNQNIRNPITTLLYKKSVGFKNINDTKIVLVVLDFGQSVSITHH